MTQENASRFFEWDHSDRLRSFHTQAGDSEPSVYSHYMYDSAGQRVKKVTRKSGANTSTTVYIDNVFEEHRELSNGTDRKNTLFHIMDNDQRIAVRRVGDAFPGDNGPAVQYHFVDHLGSSNLVVDDSGSCTNREEYTPYGETSFGSFAKKRYRYNGKEKDEHSGLYYYGARYYAPWLGRWLSADPAGPVDGLNLYTYVSGNPVRLRDPVGRQQAVADGEGVDVDLRRSTDNRKLSDTIIPNTSSGIVDNSSVRYPYDEFRHVPSDQKNDDLYMIFQGRLNASDIDYDIAKEHQSIVVETQEMEAEAKKTSYDPRRTAALVLFLVDVAEGDLETAWKYARDLRFEASGPISQSISQALPEGTVNEFSFEPHLRDAENYLLYASKTWSDIRGELWKIFKADDRQDFWISLGILHAKHRELPDSVFVLNTDNQLGIRSNYITLARKYFEATGKAKGLRNAQFATSMYPIFERFLENQKSPPNSKKPLIPPGDRPLY